MGATPKNVLENLDNLECLDYLENLELLEKKQYQNPK